MMMSLGLKELRYLRACISGEMVKSWCAIIQWPHAVSHQRPCRYICFILPTWIRVPIILKADMICYAKYAVMHHIWNSITSNTISADALPPSLGWGQFQSWNWNCLQSQFRNWNWRCHFNKVWWQCLVPTSTTRFASDAGYRMAKM